MAYDAASMQDASAFKQIVAAQALSQNADLIYLVGDSTPRFSWRMRLHRRMTQANRIPPHILVGAQTLMSPFFGVGSDAGALAARANPNALSPALCRYPCQH